MVVQSTRECVVVAPRITCLATAQHLEAPAPSLQDGVSHFPFPTACELGQERNPGPGVQGVQGPASAIEVNGCRHTAGSPPQQRHGSRVAVCGLIWQRQNELQFQFPRGRKAMSDQVKVWAAVHRWEALTSNKHCTMVRIVRPVRNMQCSQPMPHWTNCSHPTRQQTRGSVQNMVWRRTMLLHKPRVQPARRFPCRAQSTEARAKTQESNIDDVGALTNTRGIHGTAFLRGSKRAKTEQPIQMKASLVGDTSHAARAGKPTWAETQSSGSHAVQCAVRSVQSMTLMQSVQAKFWKHSRCRPLWLLASSSNKAAFATGLVAPELVS